MLELAQILITALLGAPDMHLPLCPGIGGARKTDLPIGLVIDVLLLGRHTGTALTASLSLLPQPSDMMCLISQTSLMRTELSKLRLPEGGGT